MQTAYFPYFIKLAETLSFSKASKDLNISQSGLSRAISSIEREVGCSLFLRRGNSVFLTKEGERFIEYAEEIVSVLNKIDRLSSPLKTDYLHANAKGNQLYCDATSTSFAVLAAMNKRSSTTFQELHFSELSSSLILKKLTIQKPEDPWLFFLSVPEKGKLAKKIASTRNLTFEPLLRIYAMAKVSRLSDFSKKSALSPGELSHASWAVSSDSNINDILIAATGIQSIEKNISFRSDRRDQVDRMILCDNCIGLTNSYSQNALSSRFAAVPFQREAVSVIGLISRNDIETTQDVELLRRKIVVACNKLKQLPW